MHPTSLAASPSASCWDGLAAGWCGSPPALHNPAPFRNRPECWEVESTMARTKEASFAVTWDYRCPFARNAHEHLLTALEAGAPWDVTFSPFSLDQVHVEEGGTPVWEDPEKARNLLAMQV